MVLDLVLKLALGLTGHFQNGDEAVLIPQGEQASQGLLVQVVAGPLVGGDIDIIHPILLEQVQIAQGIFVHPGHVGLLAAVVHAVEIQVGGSAAHQAAPRQGGNRVVVLAAGEEKGVFRSVFIDIGGGLSLLPAEQLVLGEGLPAQA